MIVTGDKIVLEYGNASFRVQVSNVQLTKKGWIVRYFHPNGSIGMFRNTDSCTWRRV